MASDFFKDDDIFVVDRGYRDVIQLLVEDANSTRLVTKTRYVIEFWNGHYQSKFYLFQHTILSILYQNVPHLINYFNICGAIINIYSGPILMKDATAKMAREILQRAANSNHLTSSRRTASPK